MNNIEKSMLYPGTCGITNQTIAEAQTIPNFSQTNYIDNSATYCSGSPKDSSTKLGTIGSLKPSKKLPTTSKSKIDHPSRICDSKSHVTVSRDIGNCHCHDIDNICRRRIFSRAEIINLRYRTVCKEKPRVSTSEHQNVLDYLIGLNFPCQIKVFRNQHNENIERLKSGPTIGKYSNPPRRIDLGAVEPLRVSDDGYKLFRDKMASGMELDSSEELIRHIKGILNRIVPQNFDQCFVDLISLEIDSRDKFTVLVNEIFSKAVNEEAYSAIFAELCSKLSSLTNDSIDDQPVTFREVLLQKCQEMFTTPLEEQLQMVREVCDSKKLLNNSDIEEKLCKFRDKYYGNIRFIGELYLKDVIVTEVICFCVDYLLANDATDYCRSILCLCKLLETCGGKLDAQSIGRLKLDNVFLVLRGLGESRRIDNRTRFRIRDLEEMRNMDWSLRSIQLDRKIEPKTLD